MDSGLLLEETIGWKSRVDVTIIRIAQIVKGFEETGRHPKET